MIERSAGAVFILDQVSDFLSGAPWWNARRSPLIDDERSAVTLPGCDCGIDAAPDRGLQVM